MQSPATATNRNAAGVFPKGELKLSTTQIPWPLAGPYELRTHSDGNIWIDGAIMSAAESIRTGFEKVHVSLRDPSAEALAKLKRSVKTFPGYVYDKKVGGDKFFVLGDGVVAYTTTARQTSVDFVIMKDGQVIFTYEGHAGPGNLGLENIMVAHVGMSIHGTVVEPNRDVYLHSFFIRTQPGSATPKVHHVRVLLSKRSPGALFVNDFFQILSAAGSMVLLAGLNDKTDSVTKGWPTIYRVLRIVPDEWATAEARSLDEVTLYSFEPSNTQPEPAMYKNNVGEAAVDAEGNVVFSLVRSGPPSGTDLFHMDAKSFSVRPVAKLSSRRAENLMGGPGGQLLITIFDKAEVQLRELIPVSAPDDYTHFFQGDQIGFDAARLQAMRESGQ